MHTHNFYVCDLSATSISWYVCLWENYTAHESMIKLRYFLGLGPVKINIPEVRTNKCIQILGRINEEIHIVHISKYICQTTICISPHDSKVDFLPNDCRLVQSINTLTFFYKYLCGHSKEVPVAQWHLDGKRAYKSLWLGILALFHSKNSSVSIVHNCPTKYHSMYKMIHVYHVNIHKLFNTL